MNWQTLFIPSVPIAEVVLRGTLVYLLLFFLLRFLRREAGAVGIPDLLLVVLIADAAQNAIAGEYTSITEGAVLVATIAGWNYFLDWLGFKFPRAFRWLRPAPLPLVKDGRMLRRNMRQELITEEELMSLLRHQGVDDVHAVKKAYLEGDGRISVIADDSNRQTGRGESHSGTPTER
jgi:uncharacterized membrane protein YcaP (DUF421 family)